MKKLLSCALTLTFLLTTSACGWQLRGGIDTSGLDSVYISAGDPRSSFVKMLRNTLSNQQVALADSADSAKYRMVVLEENSTNRTASVTSSARAAEYLLAEEVRVVVLDKAGQTLLPETLLRAERSLDFDENQVIGKNDEINLVRKELAADLVRQLISRVQRLTAN